VSPAEAVFEAWTILPLADRDEARETMFIVCAELGEARRSMVDSLGRNYHRVGDPPDTTAGLEPDHGADYVAGARFARPKVEQPTVRYPVKSGQTIESIAEDVLGDAGAWPQIVELNSMLGPDTMQDGAPLAPGAELWVPVTGDAGIATQFGGELYGTDLLIDPNTGDLVPLGTDPTDLALVRGRRNLEQAIRHRLITHQGDNAVFPGFGLPVQVGDQNAARLVGYLASHLRTQMLADPRVDTVRKITVDDSEGETLYLTAEFEPVLGNSISVTVPWEVS